MVFFTNLFPKLHSVFEMFELSHNLQLSKTRVEASNFTKKDPFIGRNHQLMYNQKSWNFT